MIRPAASLKERKPAVGGNTAELTVGLGHTLDLVLLLDGVTARGVEWWK